MSREPQRWLAVAHILRARGNKGEVAAELLTDFPERLMQMREVFLGDRAGQEEPRRVSLKSFWMDRNHRGQGIFHFEGCSSISEAEKFRGLGVLLPFEQRVALPAGQYFVSDLVGCSVYENRAEAPAVASSPKNSGGSPGSAPALLGVVGGVQFTGEGRLGTPLLEVARSSGQLLVPLAEEICKRIDIVARRIDVVLPEGLRELNEEI